MILFCILYYLLLGLLTLILEIQLFPETQELIDSGAFCVVLGVIIFWPIFLLLYLYMYLKGYFKNEE